MRLERNAALQYGSFLTQPWKLVTFALAATFVTFAGQFSYDDTWDLVNGAGMSILTYLSAPWAVGIIIRRLQGTGDPATLFIALVAMFFSASWFYDGWLVLRDGHYPSTWLPNLFLSPVIYIAAGLFWNLEVDTEGRPSFGFLRPEWYRGTGSPLSIKARHLAYMLPFVGVAAFILLFSVRWQFLDWSLVDLLPADIRTRIFADF
jgi:hypothetical protein